MRIIETSFLAFGLAAIVALSACTAVAPAAGAQRVEGAASASGGPRYAVDASWPKPLPNNWILGQVAGIATAGDGSIWMIHRPLSLAEDERGAALTLKRSNCITQDGLVYGCDRMNNRIQVFKKSGEFVRQFVYEPDTRGSGSVWDLVPSEDPSQRYLLVADGTNNEVRSALCGCHEVVSGQNAPYTRFLNKLR